MRTLVLLENIRSMYNVGSIFRTCDGAGIDELYLTGYTAHPPRVQITKTSLGSEETVPWQHWGDPLACVQALKEQGIKIVAVETGEGAVDIGSFKRGNEDICLIFGNEVGGVSEALLEEADEKLVLPMRGMKVSLNVSVCVGASLYHPNIIAKG